MSAKRPQPDSRHDDSYDASLTPVDDGVSPDEAGEDTDAAAAALRMDMLGAAADAGAYEPPRRRILGAQNGLLLLVLMAAVGALFAMRYLGMGPRTSLAQSSKQDALDMDKRLRVSGTDHKKVIAELSASRITGQVPTDQVQRNPFTMSGVIEMAQAKTAPAPGETPEEAAARAKRAQEQKEAAEREQKIKAAVASIVVNSVLVGGPVSVARINGELVKIGDSVAEVLTVKDIHGRGVVLEAGGKTYEIDVATGASSGSGSGRGKPPSPPSFPPRK